MSEVLPLCSTLALFWRLYIVVSTENQDTATVRAIILVWRNHKSRSTVWWHHQKGCNRAKEVVTTSQLATHNNPHQLQHATFKIVGFLCAGSCQEHPGGCGHIQKRTLVTFSDAEYRGEDCVKVRRARQVCFSTVIYLSTSHLTTEPSSS